MKILKARVLWREDYHNHPDLQILVDEYPDDDKRVYTQKGNLYFSNLDGFCSFFAYDKPGEGYGGSQFPLKMDDGTTKVLIGPWSSRAGVMNNVFEPCVEVVMTDRQEDWDKKYQGGRHGAITLDLAQQAAKLANCFLVKTVDTGDITWWPSLDDKLVVKRFKSFKRKKFVYLKFIHNRHMEYDTLQEAREHKSTQILGEIVKDSKGMGHTSLYAQNKTIYPSRERGEYGFYTDNGMFFNPKEAAVLAYAFGQIKEPKETLDIKDIYPRG